MPQSPVELANLLQYDNGWVRDKAQQLLVDGKYTSVAPDLRRIMQESNDAITITHIIWTLEGLGMLQYEDLIPLFKHPDWKVRVEAISAASSVINKGNYRQFTEAMKQMLVSNDTLTAPYLAFQLAAIRPFNMATADDLWMDIARKYPDNIYVADALISNLEKREEVFFKKIRVVETDTNLAIIKRFEKTLEDIIKNEYKKNTELLIKKFPQGARLYENICKTCHGNDGNGVASLAPPLNQSSWVTGDKKKLIAIVLYGLVGPVTVNGKLYQNPEISGEMPGLGSNDEYNEEDIAQVLSFIRKNWGNNASVITKDDVMKVRKQWNGKRQAFTEEELNAW